MWVPVPGIEPGTFGMHRDTRIRVLLYRLASTPSLAY